MDRKCGLCDQLRAKIQLTGLVTPNTIFNENVIMKIPEIDIHANIYQSVDYRPTFENTFPTPLSQRKFRSNHHKL